MGGRAGSFTGAEETENAVPTRAVAKKGNPPPVTQAPARQAAKTAATAKGAKNTKDSNPASIANLYSSIDTKPAPRANARSNGQAANNKVNNNKAKRDEEEEAQNDDNNDDETKENEDGNDEENKEVPLPR
jgi:hypothetical protein